MLTPFLSTFSRLPRSNRAMVYLMWIYGVGAIVTDTFVNIYVFKLHSSIVEVVIYNALIFSAGTVGFTFLGLLMGIWGKDIKSLYYVSYILFVIAYLALLGTEGLTSSIYIFGVLIGLGNGMFWNAVHTQELQNIANRNRDFYSSSISAGESIIAIVMPFGIAGIFYLGNLIEINGYWILFGLLPLMYMCSIFFIRDVASYIPKKVERHDISNFFDFRKYGYGHLYFLFGGMLDAIKVVILPIITIIMLRNEVNIGLFQGVLMLVSTILVLYLSTKRQESNRIIYFSIIYGYLALVYILFAWQFSLIGFVIFSLVILFSEPFFRVSQHVYDLSLMDAIRTGGSDFYPAMLMREIILWIGRIGAFIILLSCFFLTGSDIVTFLRIGLIYAAIVFPLVITSIHMWEKYEKNIAH